NELYPANGTYNWQTEIASVKFPSCVPINIPNFSLGSSPLSQTVAPGQSTSYALAITPVNGFSGNVSLSINNLPTGANGTFSPNPAASASTLTVTTTSATPPGNYVAT